MLCLGDVARTLLHSSPFLASSFVASSQASYNIHSRKETFSLQVDRHLRKLDQELSKFKMELEADCAGITETLEKSESLLTVFHFQ